MIVKIVWEQENVSGEATTHEEYDYIFDHYKTYKRFKLVDLKGDLLTARYNAEKDRIEVEYHRAFGEDETDEDIKETIIEIETSGLHTWIEMSCEGSIKFVREWFCTNEKNKKWYEKMKKEYREALFNYKKMVYW